MLNRMTAHKKALGSVLHVGAARNHRGNPVASLRAEKLYGEPVLLSGLAALVLLKSETEMIDHHHKVTLERFMRLHQRTPKCVVSFLAGSLPGTALLHQRMLGLFGMICRLPGSVLHRHASNILVVSKASSSSWFIKIRELCLQYSLPHPLILLQSPESKLAYKKLIKKHIINYWEHELRSQAQELLSLEYFHPNFMSLTSPHAIWTTAGSSPYQVSMATIQALMISGRYRTEALCSHWIQDNDGSCQTSTCRGTSQPEDLRHILAKCPSLDQVRKNLLNFSRNYCRNLLPLLPIVQTYCNPAHPSFCQFLVDCSVLPEPIRAVQVHGPDVMFHLFRVTRTWCYCLHRARLRLLGRWNKY